MSGPARGPSYVWRLVFCAVVAVPFCVTESHCQDVAEAARQQKTRKTERQATHHVYTDDDLKRKVILTPEDQARTETRKKQQNSVPGEQDASSKPQPVDAAPATTESLGDIARRYRMEKAGREAALAAKKKFTPFPYGVPNDALAEPKIGTTPITGVLPGLERRPEMAPEVRSGRRLQPPVALDHHGRISPFEPRPVLGGSAVKLPAIAPVPSRPLRTVAPVSGAGSLEAADPVGAGLKSIQVMRGQSWWKLAETYLGSGARWPELRKLNAEAGDRPEFLKAGSRVVVPANGSVTQASSQTITVSKGDSLWSLAEQHLGRGSAWTCLASANPRISDYMHLAIGTVLQVPSGGAGSCEQSQADLVRR